MSTKNDPPKKLDRRVRRTRQQLREALLELILEKGYDDITVQEITDRADLARATFYIHYRDKDELLSTSLEEMFDALVESKLDFSAEAFFDLETPHSVIAFQHVQEYHKLYRVMLSERGITHVIYRIHRYLALISKQQIEALLPTGFNPPLPLEIVAQHCAGSLFALIRWWLENDMPYSAEEMARMFQQLSTNGLARQLGFDLQTLPPSTTTLPDETP